MSGRKWHYPLLVALLGILFLRPERGVFAQNGGSVILTPPDASSFPNLAAYLDVHDSSGDFVHGLTMQDITIMEDEAQAPVTSLTEIKPGVQLVIAISPGSTLSIRDGSGTSRFQYLLQGMLASDWSQQTSGVDDLSLITVGGPQLIHSSDPAALRSSLASYQPVDSDDSPNLEVLSSALQLISSPTPRTGMERAILFITPPQTTDVSLGLQSIIANANQQNIHIFAWLVAAEEVFDMPETDLLRNLASQTQAAFFEFSHAEPIPDLNTLLEPLRYVYQLGYSSPAVAAGTHQVAAQVKIDGAQIISLPQTFTLNLQAPSLIFLNPPTEIERKFLNQPAPGEARTPDDLQPAEILLNIQISFPDGYAHSVTRTSLFVDGQMVAENTSPPFDKLVWDLRPYTTEGSHTLKIEANDNLGLVGNTGVISVRITVPSTSQEVVAVVSERPWLIIGIATLILASILVLVLIVVGRIHPKPYPWQVKPPASLGEDKRPVSSLERKGQVRHPGSRSASISPDLVEKSRSGIRNWVRRLLGSRGKETTISVMAYLVPLVGAEDPTLPAPLQITANIVSLGTDPHQATLVIDDPSIERLHATIHYDGKSFDITDAGSVAGTWVNYEQVSPEGKTLSHADIIHLGRVGFRFNLPVHGTPPEIVVTSLEPG